MSPAQLAVDVLLGIAVVVALISCLGVISMPNVFDRLHLVTPASVLSPILVAIAVVVKELFNTRGIKALMVTAVLLVLSPVLNHATARALRIRELGDWRMPPKPQKEEREPTR
jgi:monovalent cation/proton antiporter MnhG/PhaG subunit